jgi:hypothetical protein
MRVDHFDSGVAKTCLAEDARVRGAYATPLQHEACPTRVWSDAVAGYKVLGSLSPRRGCRGAPLGGSRCRGRRPNVAYPSWYPVYPSFTRQNGRAWFLVGWLAA